MFIVIRNIREMSNKMVSARSKLKNNKCFGCFLGENE